MWVAMEDGTAVMGPWPVDPELPASGGRVRALPQTNREFLFQPLLGVVECSYLSIGVKL